MRVLFFFLPVLFFAATLRAQVGGIASYQSAIWDKDITLPPGSYRTAKPLGIEGDLTVRTQPHSLIEGVAFLTRGGRQQHYHLEGTLLRRCRFTVKLSGSGHAIDSVLEDCNFHKDDSWFVDFWSTRWQFENCIFTKQFVRDGLPPLDYSVHAFRCTVYNTKLPPVYFRRNSGDWMGKNDMVFEKCRFVDCDVPQSFLACTKDCVFEGCRFEPKMQLKWPQETSAIKVHAYFASGGSELTSFINGPLSVEFEKAPMKLDDFGSTIPHTQSGGRVTLTKDKPSEQFVMLGTATKKASEIVDVAAATPTPAVAASPGPAMGAGAGGPAVPAANEISSVEEILRALPSNVEVMARGLPNPAGVEAANVLLAKSFAGRPVAMRLTLGSTQATTDEGYAYLAAGKPQGVLYHGATVPAGVTAMFRAANVAPLAKVPANTEFAVRGVVRKAEFVGRGTTLGFSLVVGETRVIDALSLRAPPAAVSGSAPAITGVSPSVAGSPHAGAAADDPAQVIGVWNSLIHVDGNHFEVHYDADHAFYADGKRAGTWEIINNQLVVTLDRDHVDHYDLPVRDGVLYGKNTLGWILTLVRPGTPTPPTVQAQVVGLWEFRNLTNPSTTVYSLNADQSIMDGERLAARWVTFGNAFVFEWEGHPEWHDMFELPGTGGILKGVNGYRASLTLTRKGEAIVPKAVPGGTPRPAYFGKEGVR